MNTDISYLKDKLVEKGLKVTPQRMSILEAVYKLNNHPTADQIIDFIKPRYPGIASGTVYKVLDTLVHHDLVKKVKTEKDIMRYDGIIDNHHHLYCVECDYIVDYNNSGLDEILKSYFEKNQIDNFIIEDIRLQINGRFIVHHIQ
jgi:Fur family transcriptional regulator, peroxide stress response regulator